MTLPASQHPTLHRKLGPALALLAGLGWLIPISVMAERVGNLLGSRLLSEYRIATHAELLLFVLSALPLAFVHDRRASILRVAATHGAVIAMLATVSLMVSPATPAPILPWSHFDPDAVSWISGPLLIWCVATSVVATASLFTARMLRDPGTGKRRQLVMLGVAALTCYCQWRMTRGMIATGWLAMKRGGLFWEHAIWLAVVLAYLAVGAVLSGLMDRRATVDSN